MHENHWQKGQVLTNTAVLSQWKQLAYQKEKHIKDKWKNTLKGSLGINCDSDIEQEWKYTLN